RHRGGGGSLLRGGARVGGVGLPGLGAGATGAWDWWYAPVHATVATVLGLDWTKRSIPRSKKGPHGIVGAPSVRDIQLNPARTHPLPGRSRNRAPVPRAHRVWPRTRPQRERPPGSWPRNCWTRRNTPTPPGRCPGAPRPPALPRPPAPTW